MGQGKEQRGREELGKERREVREERAGKGRDTPFLQTGRRL